MFLQQNNNFVYTNRHEIVLLLQLYGIEIALGAGGGGSASGGGGEAYVLC